MSPKQPAKGSIKVNTPTSPDAPQQGNTGRATRTGPEPSLSVHPATRPGGTHGAHGTDSPEVTRPPPVVITHTTTASVKTGATGPKSLESYRILAPDRLPRANTEGLRMYKGREYVDVAHDSIVMVGVDPQTGLYRAQLAAERVASGPLLLRDSDSSLWHSLEDGDAVTLIDTHLQTLHTNLDLTRAKADSDGLLRHEGRLYLLLHNQVYQVMHDVSASTATHKAWRIVNPKDPVAIDSANIFRASRSGETRSVRRDEGNRWVYHLPDLKGGIQDAEIVRLSKDTLMQMYEPFHKAHTELTNSSDRHNTLWAQTQKLAEGSAERIAKLLSLEVHLLKHVQKQADFVESLVLNRKWLVLAKASGLFKQELHTFRIERAEFLNRLMAAMDLRVKPTISSLDADSCKRIIPHLNKKLRFIEEREVVLAEIRKADPGAAPILEEIRQQVPSAERINFNKLTLYIHLFAGTPEHSPNTTMPSLSAVDLVTADLKNIPQHEHPMALLLSLDQIRADKSRFEMQLAANADTDALRAGYLREILDLIDPFEKRIENRLSDILESIGRDRELPNIDHDIDFDFLPALPDPSESPRPSAPRKIFRVRQHGTYRVLVGETETALDGNVIVKVPDPLRPGSPSARYEKRQGEWLPVRPPIVSTPRPQLVAEAKRLLVDVEQHVAKAKVDEAKKTNPTEILEGLGKEAESLNEQARRLESHEDATNDAEILALAARLRSAAESLDAHGQSVLVRMYKNRDVLDIMRLNYLMDAKEVSVSKTVERKQSGKGRDKSFLDVYSITDRTDGTPLWEAHFHYDQHNTAPLSFTTRGGHLKTLEQSRRGIDAQRRDEQAGLPHVAIWRQTFDGKTARKIFALASPAGVPSKPE
ncbi:hypothetical protein [Pseudomonas sp. IT-232MI5]|uniref:hypothetical protein n=1 Tax=Pseudomonas sp. IT-232MI5 TaxID=3026442 RepID=UPI0039E0A53C